MKNFIVEVVVFLVLGGYILKKAIPFIRTAMEKTQEKIIKAGLPQYLATRLAYGR